MLTVLVLAVASEIPAEAGPPSVVQERLDQYNDLFVGGEAGIRLVMRAERPWNLTKDMRWPVVGNSVHFQADQPLTWSSNKGPSPLPFPPKVVWCALLETEDEATGAQSYSIVLVGLHIDMYNGDWMIHQAPNKPLSALDETLSVLGCDLELD
jgi:hypothetical protein